MYVKPRPYGECEEGALLWPLRKPTRCKALNVGKRPPLARARVSTPYFPETDRGSLVRCVSGRDGRRRHAEVVAGMGMCLKRMMDVLLSSLAFLFLWPLMVVIAIAVKLESPGPVIYRSLRVGKGGREFNCYKFRTMVAGSAALKESLNRLNQRRGPFFKIADDPRVTRFGRFLRKYSLDELPQLWNVLKGDMSLVGPRPLPVEDCAQYSSEHRRRLDVTPVVTGLGQAMARAT